jgi:tripartite-type tricarboxylate transporter receptor subunit TctC
MTCTTRLFRVGFLAAFAVLALGAAGPALAFPDKPIRIVIPTQQGGSTDVTARIFQEAIERLKLLPQPLAVVNVPGAGGSVGTRQVKDAAPDGYTLGVWHSGLLTAAAMGVTEYDHTAFELVAETGSIPLGLAVKDSSPFKTIQDVVAAAKAKPEQIRMATNIGLTVHFVPLVFQAESGVKFRYVQTGGGSRRLQAILGEHTEVSLFSAQEFVTYGPSGLRPVVLFAEQRNPKLPELPTAKERGWNVVWDEVFVWLAPKGTPKDRIDVITDALRKAFQDPAVIKKYEDQAMNTSFRTGAELKPRFDELLKRAKVVAADIKSAQQEKKQ